MPHRHYNGLKTALLFGLLGAVILGASYLLFGRSLAALTIGLAIALLVNLGSFWFSDTVAPIEEPAAAGALFQVADSAHARPARETSSRRPLASSAVNVSVAEASEQPSGIAGSVKRTRARRLRARSRLVTCSSEAAPNARSGSPWST